jgi:membrane protease YdiL (CAAX protease family)
MEIPLQLILLSIPTIIYMLIHKLRGEDRDQIYKNVGWKSFRPEYILLGLAVAGLIGGLGWLAFRFIPPVVLQSPDTNISDYSTWKMSITSFLLAWLREAFYIALGEEIFFRGLLGGWLVRRWGFAAGNFVQAVIFLLPHLALFMVSLTLWPIVLVQFVAGWMLGWLRYRSGSIFPGWLVHSLTNALAALSVMA